MAKDALIVAGGTLDIPFIEAVCAKHDFKILLAADKGMEFFVETGIEPTHIVGDFDSVSEKAYDHFNGTPGLIWRQFPAEKDATDTGLAIRTALEYGATSIVLCGATGTRLDHVLANIYELRAAMEQGVPCEILDPHNRIYLADESFTLEKKKQYGEYISLLPLTETVEGLTLKGFKYPLTQATLTKTSLGVSNEILDEKANVTFRDGILIVIEAKD